MVNQWVQAIVQNNTILCYGERFIRLRERLEYWENNVTYHMRWNRKENFIFYVINSWMYYVWRKDVGQLT